MWSLTTVISDLKTVSKGLEKRKKRSDQDNLNIRTDEISKNT